MKKLRIFLISLVALIAAVVLAKAVWDFNVFSGYEPNTPLAAKILNRQDGAGYHTEKVEITGLTGERIPLRLLIPNGPPPYRCVLFLYGLGQNARFFDEVVPVFAAKGIAMAMPEQYQCGERKRPNIPQWQEPLELRERGARIVPESRRVVDYLLQRPDINPEQLDLIGTSFGAIMGCAVFAHEPRLHCATFVMCGGDISKMLTFIAAKQKPESKIVWPVAAKLGAWFIDPFEPLHYVKKSAGRPMLFLQVNQDELIDRECSNLLFRAAEMPKKEMRYDGPHAHITNETIQKMMNDTFAWLNAVNP